jgi:alpha-L-rhamnosidase
MEPSLRLVDLRCESMTDPLGIGVLRPRFSWELRSEKPGTLQTAYRIRAAETPGELATRAAGLWDSGRIEARSSIHVPYGGPALRSGQRVHWCVQAWDQDGAASRDSEVAWFEMGLLTPDDWSAQWIEPSLPPASPEPKASLVTVAFHPRKTVPPEMRLQPCTLLRREFVVRAGVKRARAYATAHGVYRIEINGSRVDAREFAPEFTAYAKLLCTQTYDVTALLAVGANAVGATVADGWWCGRVGMTGDSCQYGDRHALLLQLDIEYEDGSTERVVSDDRFRCATGPAVYSDIFIGEKHDARLERDGWSRPGYGAADWKPVVVVDHGFANLKPQHGGPVKAVMEIEPIAVLRTPKGETVVDLGQVIAGRMRLRVRGEAGTSVTLEHGEVLDQQGNFLRNVAGRNKDQTDVYVLKGGGKEVYEPAFTFHGFRFVRVTGFPGTPTVADFTGVVLSSLDTTTGRFTCSDPRLDRLVDNVVWSQRANMLSIPTDCPQRERAGWTGDIQIFAPTAAFLLDVEPFLTRWLRSVEADQLPDGQVPHVVPYLKAYREDIGGMFRTDSSAGWGDACILVPLAMYRKYGDRRVLEEMYGVMERWMDFMRKNAAEHSPLRFHLNPLNWLSRRRRETERLLRDTGWHYGDWLIPSRSASGTVGMFTGAFSTKRPVASSYYAYSAARMGEIAGILGKEDDRRRYEALAVKVGAAFASRHVRRNGRMRPATIQGVYILALQFGLVPEKLRARAVEHLVRLIHRNGDRLDTGFLSVPHLLDVLADNGHRALADKLLYQEECPSWLYEVKRGATTIWESWKAIEPDGRVTDVSYNHYAFGCVGDWMVRTIGGLEELEPGYLRFRVAPCPDASLTHAEIVFHSVHGGIEVAWKRVDGRFHLRVAVPCNTTAQVEMPDGTRREVGSGEYAFECRDGGAA